ncbi:hypothetical protein D3C86_1125550 [compost metagenome]
MPGRHGMFDHLIVRFDQFIHAHPILITHIGIGKQDTDDLLEISPYIFLLQPQLIGKFNNKRDGVQISCPAIVDLADGKSINIPVIQAEYTC